MVNIKPTKVSRHIDRSNINLKSFFKDMNLIGKQVRDPSIEKPDFHYGDVSVTNYLLWLILAELMMTNDLFEDENDEEVPFLDNE